MIKDFCYPRAEVYNICSIFAEAQFLRGKIGEGPKRSIRQYVYLHDFYGLVLFLPAPLFPESFNL